MNESELVNLINMLNINGLGLGLSVAKHVTEFYNGYIRIESRVGEGTDVFITLPGMSEP
ncbi:ATP-binding protein [Desulfonema magnum]|uniref:histidine kinase n=1 Tax=Desulfonema magnum TaxID=45655 RepID=A0A975BNQ1_9BACT|nr:ATP-binding protein [Desulfonema magnum]QTA88868.1 Histidine kinase domain-containing protein [Desulfonema magnum]